MPSWIEVIESEVESGGAGVGGKNEGRVRGGLGKMRFQSVRDSVQLLCVETDFRQVLFDSFCPRERLVLRENFVQELFDLGVHGLRESVDEVEESDCLCGFTISPTQEFQR